MKNVLACDAFVQIFQRYLAMAIDPAFTEVFGDPNPNTRTLLENTDMAFFNGHFIFENIRPLNPNIMNVGGCHIKKELDPLPKDLKEFMDGAKDGVVLISFGSVSIKTILYCEPLAKMLFAGISWF